MDSSRIPLINWPSSCFHQDKSMEEFRESLLLTMELEDVKRMAAKELGLKELQISRLKELLSNAIKEKEEAQESYRKIAAENALLHRQLRYSSFGEEPRRGIESNSSPESDESIVSSPVMVERPLPEKGKLLEAVMKAGPLLQTLLVAGPLPQWRHPPPLLDAHQIPPPPVILPQQQFLGGAKKRSFSEASDC